MAGVISLLYHRPLAYVWLILSLKKGQNELVGRFKAASLITNCDGGANLNVQLNLYHSDFQMGLL